MNLDFLAQTDAATIRLEKAKRHLDSAKAELEAAKQFYDELLALAEDHGFTKAKIKKLSDERVSALFEAGLIEMAAGSPKPAAPSVKVDRPKKAKKVSTEEGSLDDSFAQEEQIDHSPTIDQ